MNMDEILQTAIEAAELGASLNRAAFRASNHRVTSKGAIAANTVTATDHSTEAAIRAFIADRYPDHIFLGEESDDEHGGGATTTPLWIVDPIDGTNNFIHGFPHYSVSVAVAVGDEIEVGVIVDVERGECFSAIRGRGAWLDRPGEKREVLAASGHASLEGALIITGFYYERGSIMHQTLDTIATLFGRGIHGIRRTGSAAIDICWVAAGRADAFFELVLQSWDFAAAMLIAREAGAAAMDTDGKALCLTSNSVIIGSTTIADTIVGIVQGRQPGGSRQHTSRKPG